MSICQTQPKWLQILRRQSCLMNVSHVTVQKRDLRQNSDRNYHLNLKKVDTFDILCDHIWDIIEHWLGGKVTICCILSYCQTHCVSDTLCVRHTDPRVRSSILKILFWSAPNLFRPKTHRLGCACGRDECYRHQMWSMEYQTQNTEIQNKHKIQKYKKNISTWLRMGGRKGVSLLL